MTRYSRQIAVKALGEAGQKRLQSAHVGIVGLGGLGSPVSVYLAGAGIGKMTLIDHDCVSLTNLHRQVLYRESDIGRKKVEVAHATLRDLNREIELESYAEKLTAASIENVLGDVDVLVDATDNFALSYLLSDFALSQAKTLVSASVMRTDGYVGVYCHSTVNDTSCPSLRAVFPNPPAVGQDCNSVGVIGTAAGLVGVLQAQEVIKVVLGDQQQLAGRLLTLDCWTYRQSIIDFSDATEPDVYASIIAEGGISDSDWVIDVRRADEVELQPKFSHQQTPMQVLDIASLPSDKRLVFTCASGQRALSVADKALSVGYKQVAVWV